MRAVRARSRAVTLAVVLALGLAPPAVAAGRASFVQIQNDMMCVACHEPLAVAQSQEAFSERQFIRDLIAQGLTKSQIERQMVAQYGPQVLARPPAHGFNLLVYLLPPAIVGLGLLTLAVTLPRWRRRTRAAAGPYRPASQLSPEDARRLAEDLARHA